LFDCLLALAMCMPVLANAEPVINCATPNYATNQLTNVGTSFGTAPTVKIDPDPDTGLAFSPSTAAIGFSAQIAQCDNPRCHAAQRRLRRQLSADRDLGRHNRII
jgi:hypothetical protein